MNFLRIEIFLYFSRSLKICLQTRNIILLLEINFINFLKITFYHKNINIINDLNRQKKKILTADCS